MRIDLCSVYVNDQDRAVAFYTDVLGFVLTSDQPAGDFRWITVASPEDLHGVQLVLEPLGLPAAAEFQAVLYRQGIPFTSFGVPDVQAEYERHSNLGVRFAGPVDHQSWGDSAVLDDTCGNLIMLHQLAPAGQDQEQRS